MSEEHIITGNIRGLREELAKLKQRLDETSLMAWEKDQGWAAEQARVRELQAERDRYKSQRDAMRRALDQCLLPTGQAGAPGGDQQLALDLWKGQHNVTVPTLILQGICAGRRLERERLDAKWKALQPSLPCQAEGVNQCAYPDSCPPNRCRLREAQDMRNAL